MSRISHLISILGCKELNYSCFKPRSILIIFICCDLTNLILQGVGGAISSTSLHRDQIQTGINVIIAGLATQVTSLLMFIGLGVEFAFRVCSGNYDLATNTSELRQTRVWKAFLFGMSVYANSLSFSLSLSAGKFAIPTHSPPPCLQVLPLLHYVLSHARVSVLPSLARDSQVRWRMMRLHSW